MTSVGPLQLKILSTVLVLENVLPPTSACDINIRLNAATTSGNWNFPSARLLMQIRTCTYAVAPQSVTTQRFWMSDTAYYSPEDIVTHHIRRLIIHPFTHTCASPSGFDSDPPAYTSVHPNRNCFCDFTDQPLSSRYDVWYKQQAFGNPS